MYWAFPSVTMFVERKVCYSALFTYLVGWHAVTVSFPPSDIILAQLACPLSDIMFWLHSGITNLSLYTHCSVSDPWWNWHLLVCWDPRPEYLTGMWRACLATLGQMLDPLSLAWMARSRTAGRFARGVSFLGLAMPRLNGPLSPWIQCYKTFFVRNFGIFFVKIYSFCPW
jgi:hypothetical protein